MCGYKLAIVVDEFEHLTDIQEFALFLRQLVRTTIVAVLSGAEDAHHELVEGHPGIARNITAIELSAFNKMEFQELFYLVGVMSDERVCFTSDAVDTLYEMSAGWPYFAQLFGRLLILERAKTAGSITAFYNSPATPITVAGEL